MEMADFKRANIFTTANLNEAKLMEKAFTKILKLNMMAYSLEDLNRAKGS